MFSQKIVENKIDEFTGDKIIKSSWQKLIWSGKGVAYFRINEFNNVKFFDFKFFNRQVFSIDKGDKIMLKLDNGEFVTLLNNKFTITCTGCGSIGLNGSGVQGINVLYRLNEEDLKNLQQNKVEKIRFYTSKGYSEHKIKEKYSTKISKSIELFK